VAGLRLPGPAREDDPPAPTNAYGESKLLGEELLRRVAGLRWSIVRPPWVYGPGDRATFALFRLAARGIFPSVAGGCLEISMVHVDDLVEALVLVGESPRADGRVYYACEARCTRSAVGCPLLAACVAGACTCRAPSSA
jgi:UDP-glucose 4-epimerase